MRCSHFQSPANYWKISQSDWPRAFWAISQEPEFSQIWNLFSHTRITVIQTFIIDQIDKKNKELRKTELFYRTFEELWACPILGGKHVFQKIWLSYTTPHEPLTPCWLHEKAKEPIPRKLLNRRTDRTYSYDPSGYGQDSYKRISQLRGSAIDNKNKIQYISA